MTETIVVCVGLYVAWKILSAVNEPGSKPQQFASTAAAAPAPPPAYTAHPGLPVANVLAKPDLAFVRKKLAADEKLTPELKAAFDLIQAALEEK